MEPEELAVVNPLWLSGRSITVRNAPVMHLRTRPDSFIVLLATLVYLVRSIIDTLG